MSAVRKPMDDIILQLLKYFVAFNEDDKPCRSALYDLWMPVLFTTCVTRLDELQ